MKQSILYSLLLITLFTGCKSPAEPDVPEIFEPYQIGSWMITSPETAEWLGQESYQKSAVDTIVVTSNEEYHLKIEQDSTYSNDGANIIFTDSSATYLGYDLDKQYDFNIYFPMNSKIQQGAGYNVSGYELYMEVILIVKYDSTQTNSSTDFIYLDVLVDGVREITYSFSVTGIDNTMYEVLYEL